MNGNTERAQCALSRVSSLRKRKRKTMKRIKQFIKYPKKVIKKKIVPTTIMLVNFFPLYLFIFYLLKFFFSLSLHTLCHRHLLGSERGLL